MTRDQTGITVKLLDFSEVTDDVVRDTEADGANTMAWGMVERPEGIYMVTTEGTGPAKPVDVDNPATVDIWTRTETETGHTGSMLPEYTLTIENPRDYIGTNEIDLADHIRSFGNRLNRNFDMWKEALS